MKNVDLATIVSAVYLIIQITSLLPDSTHNLTYINKYNLLINPTNMYELTVKEHHKILNLETTTASIKLKRCHIK